MKAMKKIPKFKDSKTEKRFWKEHDSTEYLDWSKAKRVKFPKLKPSTEVISLRLTEELLTQIKILAHREDVPYQSLIKVILSQGVKKFSAK